MSAEQEVVTPPLQPGTTEVKLELSDHKRRGALFWLVILGINVSSFLALLEVVSHI